MRIFPVVLLCLPIAAHGAALRYSGIVQGPVVRLSDLWDDVGREGARVLGPGPAPGERIVVGAAQLGAIARAYGVAWQPLSAADQAVLERPGAALSVTDVISVLRPALIAQGAGAGNPSFEIALPLFDPPMLDAGARPALRVEQLTFDAAAQRFSALVVVDASGEPTLRLRLAGSVEASVSLVVPTRRLLPGSVIGPGDLAVVLVRASLVTAPVALVPAQAVGLAVRHAVFPGQPLPLAELVHPDCVAKGDRVMMVLNLPGLDVGGVGEALQGGAVGERIAVRNPVSGAILTADITAPDQVRIDPVAPAALPPGQPGFTLAAR
jgi:flagella basal body P-ring formation protein FlgA